MNLKDLFLRVVVKSFQNGDWENTVNTISTDNNVQKDLDNLTGV